MSEDRLTLPDDETAVSTYERAINDMRGRIATAFALPMSLIAPRANGSFSYDVARELVKEYRRSGGEYSRRYMQGSRT